MPSSGIGPLKAPTTASLNWLISYAASMPTRTEFQLLTWVITFTKSGMPPCRFPDWSRPVHSRRRSPSRAGTDSRHRVQHGNPDHARNLHLLCEHHLGGGFFNPYNFREMLWNS